MVQSHTILRPEPLQDVPSQATAALVEASNAFAMDLWRRIRRENEDLAVSPASISMALAMVWAGARGKTAKELARTLHLTRPKSIHEAAAALLYDWNDPSRRACELRVVNRLFGERSYEFNEDFLRLVRDRYGAPLEQIDFRNTPEPSRAHINAWLEAQTAKRIRNLIPPGTVDDRTRLVLVNAVYFLGKWVQPFDKLATLEAPFYPAPGRSVPVSMMHQTEDFPYYDTGDLKILQMWYLGREFAMTVLLPSDVDGLAALEEQISTKKLDRWLAKLRMKSVSVALPKFTIDPSQSIDLVPVLGEMGTRLAFDPNAADFTMIANPPDPEDRLFLNHVRHKALVKVDEKGTEATAATATDLSMAAPMDLTAPKQFRADHPFLFLIRDIRSEMILFVGRVAEPQA